MATPFEEAGEIQKNAKDPEHDYHYWNGAFVVELIVMLVMADFNVTIDSNCRNIHDRAKTSDNAKESKELTQVWFGFKETTFRF